MYFRLRLIASGIALHPDGINPLMLTLKRAHQVKVTISSLEQETGDVRLDCLVETSFDPGEKVSGAFEDLLASRLPSGHPPMADWPRTFEQIDEEGSIQPNFVVPLWLMPEAFRLFASKLSDELHDAAEAILGVLRWRSRSLGSPRPFGGHRVEWSTDEERWRGMPSSRSGEVGSADYIELSESGASEIASLVECGRLEPLGHVLFREAWSQRQSNPRGSLLLGMTALEIGVKEYVAASVPEAKWLAMNAPTPPLVTMLEEYLPQLASPGGGPPLTPLDGEIVETLKVGTKLRNESAHRGTSISNDRLLKTLRAVRNVLWRLDEASGRDWAPDHLFPSVEEDVSQGYRRI